MKIVVYGDLIIDTYIYGTSERLSPEAPVPVVKFQKEVTTEGGAGNVYNNIKSLTPNTILGTKCLDTPPIKKRVFSDGHYVTRIDYEGETRWEHDYIDSDLAVVSDYAKGAFNTLNLSKLPRKTIVDPKGSLNKYKGVWCLKPNLKEFSEFCYSSSLEENMKTAREFLDVEHLIVTLGSEGVAYCSVDGWYKIPAEPVEVFDVTGAGDTFTAVLTYGLSKNMSVFDSIKLANKAAAVAVTHRGTYVIKPSDLLEQPLVFTNGCFDILHPGHIRVLNECRKMGRVVIGLNSDASVKRLKGNSRPINNQETRKLMLESLGFDVIIFDENSPAALIERLNPDIVVKGGDYSADKLKSTGGAKIVIVPFVEGYSTSNIVKRIIDEA